MSKHPLSAHMTGHLHHRARLATPAPTPICSASARRPRGMTMRRREGLFCLGTVLPAGVKGVFTHKANFLWVWGVGRFHHTHHRRAHFYTFLRLQVRQMSAIQSSATESV